MVRLVAGLYDRVRHLIPELAKFGVVGGIGAIIDLGGAAVLYHHVGPLKAKAISITAATIVTYFGSRFWTFRHRENQPLLREGVLFVALNVVGLFIAEAVIACTTYVLGYKDPIAYNVASLVGTGLGTIFRYFAYRKWVFLAPATAGEPAAQPVPAAAESPTYRPWDPSPWEAEQREPALRGPAQRGPARRGPAEWEPMPWETAEEPAYSGVPIHESGQVRLPTRVRPNRASTGPIVLGATMWSAGPTWPASAAGTGPRPAPAGSRAPGRHRKA